jgi:para-nitrobenzyl esterase
MIRKLMAAAAFAVALSPVALAQDAPKFSSKTSTIGQILDNAEAKAVFTKVMPEVAAAPELEQAREMTIEAVKGMAPEYFPEEKVKELDVELAKIK